MNINLIRYAERGNTVYGIQVDNVVVTSITPEGLSYEPLPIAFTVERSLIVEGSDKTNKLYGQFVRDEMFGYECSGLVVGVFKKRNKAYVLGTISRTDGHIAMYDVPLKRLHKK